MRNIFDPSVNFDTEDRLAEIASILAAGLMRLRARKSSSLSRRDGESSLHNSDGESSHEPEVQRTEEGS